MVRCSSKTISIPSAARATILCLSVFAVTASPAAALSLNPLNWYRAIKMPKIEGPPPADTTEFEAGLNSLGGGFGASLPADSNGFSGATRGGPALNIQALHYFLDWVALGAEIGYSRFNGKIQGGHVTSNFLAVPGATDETLRAQVATINAVARVNILQENFWTPYVLGGTGVSFFTASGKANVPALQAPSQKVKGYSRGLYITGAAGVETFLFQGASIYFEARYGDYALSQRYFGVNAAESLSYFLGAHFWFGRSNSLTGEIKQAPTTSARPG